MRKRFQEKEMIPYEEALESGNIRCLTYKWFLEDRKDAGNRSINRLIRWQQIAMDQGFDTISECLYNYHVIEKTPAYHISYKHGFSRSVYPALKYMGIYRKSGIHTPVSEEKIKAIQNDFLEGKWRTWAELTKWHDVSAATIYKYTLKSGLSNPKKVCTKQRHHLSGPAKTADTRHANRVINEFFDTLRKKYLL
jgi:hypothetical protein